MPEPTQTLTLIAELALGLSGFSGIVVVLGRRQSGHLDAADRRRLSNLFTQAFVALFLSLFALGLLHAAIPAPTTWRSTSVVWAMAACYILPRDVYLVRSLHRSGSAKVSPWIAVPAYIASLGVAILQVANFLDLHDFWPVFVALGLSLLFALQQFVILLYSGFRAH